MILLSMKGFDIAKVWQQIKLNNKDNYFLYDTKKLLANPPYYGLIMICLKWNNR